MACAGQGRHDRAAGRVRHPHHHGDGGRAPDHDAPRTAGDLPDLPEPPRPRPRHARRPCGWRSPAPPPSPSSWSSRCASGSASRRSSRATASPSPAASPPCAATTTTPRPSRPPRAGPSPASRCAVVDDDGAELPRGEAGEVVVRGYNVMLGYFEDPEQTAEAIDADGWLRTGDIGMMDERGYLQITDRKKDMFIVGGFNVYPAEIENLLLAHPADRPGGRRGRARRPGWGRWAWPSSCPSPAREPDPDEIVAWAGSGDGQLQGPPPRPHRRGPAAQPRGQGPQVPAARGGRFCFLTLRQVRRYAASRCPT